MTSFRFLAESFSSEGANFAFQSSIRPDQETIYFLKYLHARFSQDPAFWEFSPRARIVREITISAGTDNKIPDVLLCGTLRLT